MPGPSTGGPQGYGVTKYPTTPISSDVMVAVASIAYFVCLFLPWTKSTFNTPSGMPVYIPASLNGWGGAGVAAGIFAFILFLWVGLRLARIALPVADHYRSLIAAVLGGLVFLFGLLRILTNLSLLTSHVSLVLYVYGLFAWLGLLLAILVLYGSWGEWQSWQVAQQAMPSGGYQPGQAGPVGGGYQPQAQPYQPYQQPQYQAQSQPQQPQSTAFPVVQQSAPSGVPQQMPEGVPVGEPQPQPQPQPQYYVPPAGQYGSPGSMPPVPGSTPYPPQEGPVYTVGAQPGEVCAKCGNPIMPDESFCTSCGAPRGAS